MRVAARVFDRILDVLRYLAYALIVFSGLTICAEVVLRYFVRRPIPWVVEVNEYLVVWITFLGTAWLLRREGHVVVDTVVANVNARTRTLLAIIASVIGTVVCFLLAWWGIVAVLQAYEEGTLMLWTQVNMPKWLVTAVIPLGFLMLFVQFLRRTGGYLSTFRSGKYEQMTGGRQH